MDELIAPLEWYTEQRRVSELIPYAYNPRKRTPEKIQKLKESIEKFNLAEIPVIDIDNTIISGHQRVFVLFELGRGEEIIDVRIPNRKLTEDELKEYNLRANVNIGEWDFEMLQTEFSELDFKEIGMDFNFDFKFDEKVKKETKEIKPFKKTHILLSFHPEKIIELKPFLDEILKIEDIEYEQSSN